MVDACIDWASASRQFNHWHWNHLGKHECHLRIWIPNLSAYHRVFIYSLFVCVCVCREAKAMHLSLHHSLAKKVTLENMAKDATTAYDLFSRFRLCGLQCSERFEMYDEQNNCLRWHCLWRRQKEWHESTEVRYFVSMIHCFTVTLEPHLAFRAQLWSCIVDGSIRMWTSWTWRKWRSRNFRSRSGVLVFRKLKRCCIRCWWWQFLTEVWCVCRFDTDLKLPEGTTLLLNPKV